MVFATSAVKNSLMSYTTFYFVIAGIMLAALIAFIFTVKEVKWAKEMKENSIKYGIEEDDNKEDAGKGKKLSKAELCSLILILASIALWYFGYNAVTSKYSVYAANVLQKDYNTTMLIAQAAAIVSYLPAGMIASKLGRKKTILGGVVMLSTAFLLASFIRSNSSTMIMNILFALAGIGWATINVNSFPMVVEMCTGSDVGKYTGYYYTFSMAAQIVTPLLSGFLIDKLQLGYNILFPYAVVFSVASFITMCFVRHGDSRPDQKTAIEEQFAADN